MSLKSFAEQFKADIDAGIITRMFASPAYCEFRNFDDDDLKRLEIDKVANAKSNFVAWVTTERLDNVKIIVFGGSSRAKQRKLERQARKEVTNFLKANRSGSAVSS